MTGQGRRCQRRRLTASSAAAQRRRSWRPSAAPRRATSSSCLGAAPTPGQRFSGRSDTQETAVTINEAPRLRAFCAFITFEATYSPVRSPAATTVDSESRSSPSTVPGRRPGSPRSRQITTGGFTVADSDVEQQIDDAMARAARGRRFARTASGLRRGARRETASSPAVRAASTSATVTTFTPSGLARLRHPAEGVVSDAPGRTAATDIAWPCFPQRGGAEMLGSVGDIERETVENTTFRTVLFTGEHTQLTVMSIEPGDDIGREVHSDHDQFIRIEQGTARSSFRGARTRWRRRTMRRPIGRSSSPPASGTTSSTREAAS